jgi:amino acid adenylation domain-containing protein
MIKTKDISKMTREQKQALLKELMEKKKKQNSLYSLSSGQKGLWFIQKMDPESYAYHVPVAFRIHGSPDISALKKSLQILINHHTVLKTVIQETDDGEPFQSVSSDQPLFFVEESIADMAESEIEPFLRSKAHEPFDLEKGPLMRVYLFSRSDKEHILFINLHHIIFDGTSFLIFIEELMKIYEAESIGEKALLPNMESSYADFVKWQENMLESDEGKEHKEYWLDKLSGELAVLNLPTDNRMGSEYPSGGCEIYQTEITIELSKQLKRLAEENKIYLFTVLFSAFNVLLYRYTQQEDIITGIPAVGRTNSRFEDLIGYFVNMLPMRTRISGDMSFEDLLRQVHKLSMEALERQDYPFPEIVKELGIRKEGGSHPLFQTIFVLQNWAKNFGNTFSKTRENDSSFSLDPMLNIQAEEDFDLALEIFDLEHLSFFFKYDSGLFNRNAIVRMSDHFKIFLEEIVFDPSQKISELPLLTEDERHKILVEFNDTKVDYPKDKCIHQLFEEQAEKTPDAAAVIFGDMVLSYSQLNKKANCVAHFLIERIGVAPGDKIGIMLDRSEWVPIAMIAVLKAGGVYVPTDLSYPPERVRQILTAADCRTVLTEEKHRVFIEPFFPKERIANIHGIEHENSHNLDITISRENPAYIIYTSGSTGAPKGIVQTHKCIDNLVRWQLDQTGRGWRILQYASLGFDVSLQETLYALASGSVIFVIPQERRYDIPFLADFIHEKKIDMFTMPFSALNLLFKEKKIRKNRQIKHMITSGEALIMTPELEQYLSKNRKAKLHNQYGPAETHVATAYTISGGDEIPACPPVGVPVSNTESFVLDSTLNPVPIGVKGEIYIGGACLASGYLDMPELTAEKFITHPFDKNRKVYKTGDLGRWLPDGNIEFLGRMDHQVKIRGFRIELGEIESVLGANEGIKETVVVVREDQPGNKQLAA